MKQSHLPMARHRIWVWFLALTLWLPQTHAEDMEIHGSNTIGATLAPMLVEGFLARQGTGPVRVRSNGKDNEKVLTGKHAGATVRALVAAHGSSTGFRALNNGTANIWASSRPAKAQEVAEMAGRANLNDLDSEHVIAIDGLAVLVHPSNPVSQLSIETLGRIFAGEIRNWSELGGDNQTIHLYARDDRSGTWDTFRTLVLGKAYTLASSARRYESNDRLSDDVSRDPSGIGFAGLASVRDSKVLAISDGDAPALKPNQLTVASEDYPLARRLFMYTPGKATTPLAASFIDFVLGEEGQAIVSRSGFISQNPIAVKPELDNSTPQTFRRLTENYQRLTVNFRFSEGRTRLDNKARRDLKRVSDFMSRNNRSPDDIMLIGFADQQSNELRAQMISELRALSVRKALSDLGVGDIAYTGYGHYMPVGMAGGDSGQQRNGRVEVWVRSR
ncbi:substrate-binding domain-containing protein [Marinobacter sp. M216]|uniref:Substrate-binding domain-containing protein n=1 Tax=Marinobacter albus TaxID=3030833 RepID=A0ABT7H7S4_9GAMM|nr:substrate-binding domain-containing protein [Marinobacter sp. M216]MDK9556408.1 substrate-binding domain-containing protein [Marinobacter sp. M216]